MTIIENILNELCIDERIDGGIFLIENQDHLTVLQEYLEKAGVEPNEAISLRNKITEKLGKFPDRQAYNKMGLLVTFPTPEYKKRAIDRGTHSEQDPTKQNPNIYPPAAGQAPAQAAPSPEVPAAPAPPTEKPAEPAPIQPKADAPPATMPQPVDTAPKPEAPVVAPPAAPVAPAAPAQEPKTPEQKEAEKQYVDKLLRTEISINEAKSYGWRQNLRDQWYDTNGTVRGTSKYNSAVNEIRVELS